MLIFCQQELFLRLRIKCIALLSSCFNQQRQYQRQLNCKYLFPPPPITELENVGRPKFDDSKIG